MSWTGTIPLIAAAAFFVGITTLNAGHYKTEPKAGATLWIAFGVAILGAIADGIIRWG